MLSAFSLIFITLFSVILPLLHSSHRHHIALPVSLCPSLFSLPLFSLFDVSVISSQPHFSPTPPLSPLNLLSPSIFPLISSYFSWCHRRSSSSPPPPPSPLYCSISVALTHSSSAPLFPPAPHLFFSLFSLTHPACHKQSKTEGQCCHMTGTKRTDWSSGAV